MAKCPTKKDRKRGKPRDFPLKRTYIVVERYDLNNPKKLTSKCFVADKVELSNEIRLLVESECVGC